MKKKVLAIFLSFLTTLSFGQVSDFDLMQITFGGLNFSTPKQAIVEIFGQAEIIHTDYQCGFFTNDQPGGPYYQMVYTGFKYIGSDQEDFYLQQVDFNTGGQLILSYRDMKLSAETTVEEFCRIVGDSCHDVFRKPVFDSVLLYSKGSDAGAIFTFKDGRLLRFEYWTPC
ncbi:MAG TPA: hypothetical protein DCE81_02545 [Cytophagales bacterium]|nr:hypothetical protein [Cytophagales bacterium]